MNVERRFNLKITEEIHKKLQCLQEIREYSYLNDLIVSILVEEINSNSKEIREYQVEVKND